jgi:hypothetical protein
MSKFKVINFRSKPKETFFAPEWDYYIFERKINQINFSNLAEFILSKEKEILKLPVIKDDNGRLVDGYTGLRENSTTSRFPNFNVFDWNNDNIKILKDEILSFHKDVLEHFEQPLPSELYIRCWVNIMRKGEQIKPHLHGVLPTSYLGGHICVQCDDTSTHYINPINQINEPLTYNSKNEVGKITLFQNNIPHYTDIHNTEKERITIAFDLHTTMLHSNHVKII